MVTDCTGWFDEGRRFFFRLLLSAGLFFLLNLTLAAYPLFCQITQISPQTNSLKVTCTASGLPLSGKIELRFKDQFAGITRLTDRFSQFQIKDKSGNRILPEIYGNGLYRTSLNGEGEISFEYEMQVNRINGAASDPGKYALVSTLGGQGGFLLLADLLPEVCNSGEKICGQQVVRLKIFSPPDWQIATTETEKFGAYEVDDFQKAVFCLGKIRRYNLNVERTRLEIALAGEMVISDVQINLLIGALFREQMKMLGEIRRTRYLVTLLPFPVPVAGLRSAALTRGRSVVMLLNPDRDAEQTLKLYRRHLAHELFHFYLPEAFTIRENFDWYWEGAARYIGLLTLNRLHLITRQDFLEEMENEFQAYQTNSARENISLIAASPEKFANAANYNLIYRKGTLVLWLIDLELRWQSNGKANVLELMRRLYENYGNGSHEIGNREILAALRNSGNLDKFIREYVEGTRDINLSELLKPYGLTTENVAGRVKIRVSSRLSAKQKSLLSQFE